MLFLSAWTILPLAFVLDLLIGDPFKLPHPIRLMGRAITFFEPRFRKMPLTLSISGSLFAVFLISAAFFLSLFLLNALNAIHPLLGQTGEIVLVYYCISVRSLEKAAMDVGNTLVQKGLAPSKDRLKLIVGREVDSLDETGVARATVETVAENLVDGVISPLFYAGFFGAPFAMAFKMASTLDSMVGYKNDTYIDFGKASARIDDVMNYIPARMSVFIIAFSANLLHRGTGMETLRHALKDGRKHASPNAGFPEAAFSGALKVRLGGPNYYHGKRVLKPYIGESFGDVLPGHVKRACDLMMVTSLLWFAILTGLYFVIR